MFARLVEGTAKPGKRDEISAMLANDLFPLLKRQRGFVHAAGLFSDSNLSDGAGLTVWDSKNDADAFYASAEYLRIMERVKSLMENMRIRTFTVTASTFQKMAAGGGA